MPRLRLLLVVVVLSSFVFSPPDAFALVVKVSPENISKVMYLGGAGNVACYGPKGIVGRLSAKQLSPGVVFRSSKFSEKLHLTWNKLRQARTLLRRAGRAALRNRLRRQIQRLRSQILELRRIQSICRRFGNSLGSNSSSSGSSSSQSSIFSSSSSSSENPSLEARITIDEPGWYHDSARNMCNPEKQLCYFPDLGFSLTRGYAPFGVFFQGWESSPRSKLIKYLWDFGVGTEADAAGRYFDGFNAAHIYERPGKYIVYLTVTDLEGHSSSASVQIEVLEPAGTVFYVDSALGDDGCDGKSAEKQNSTRCPWRTAQKAFGNIIRPRQWAPLSEWHYKPGDRILFKRGQTFEISEHVGSEYGFGTQGFYFGAYGKASDAKPLIQWTGASGVTMLSGYGLGYIGFVDLKFNFLSEIGQADGLFTTVCGAKNIVFLRCDFFEPNNGAWSYNGGSCEEAENGVVYVKTPTNGFMFDSTVQNPQTHATAVTQIYQFGVHGLALINNTFDQSGNHIMYSSYIDKGVVSGNTFSRPAFGRTAWRTIGGSDKYQANNIYFSDNMFLGWIDPVADDRVHNGGGQRYNYHLINFAPGGNSGELLMNNIVFERNIVTNCESAMDIVNAENVAVRNNVFVSPSPYVAQFIQLSSGFNSSGRTRPLKNIRIVGNTFVYNSAREEGHGGMVSIHPWYGGATRWGDRHESITIANNVFYGLAGIRGLAVNLYGTDNDLLSQIRSDHNLIFLPGAGSGKPFRIAANTYSLGEWSGVLGGDRASVAVDPKFIEPVLPRTHLRGEPLSLLHNIGEANQYIAALHLSSASPLADGLDLGVDSYFDFEHNSRHLFDGRIDPGAMEYSR